MSPAIKRHRISQIPLAPSAFLPTHHLTPDPLAPSVSAFRSKLLQEKPSSQRRARLLSPEAHFSYVTPFVVSGGFPYRISFEGVEEQDQPAHVEQWLAEREPIGDSTGANTRLWYPKHREEAHLIGLSENALRDCLPHLDVGDAFGEDVLGLPALVSLPTSDGNPQQSNSANQEASKIRKELVDVLSGRAILFAIDEEGQGLAPWSMRYSGHQFGNWAGQLGDGRAISIWTTPHPNGSSYELQLKGAGRTPFSRSADGLAVLRSSIREYLCSEAMQALGIPTTRALSIVHLPTVSVARERVESASIVARMAKSFVRIGSFEAFNPPDMGKMFFFGGGQQESDLEGLRILGEWVEKLLWPSPGNESRTEAWGERLVLEVARRNAKMVAGWQAYGFMHGVINTDNISILGLTIDYGPYAFMDVFDPFHICNHTDGSGRYAYMYQPNMIIYALRALLNALAPLIGAEAESAIDANERYKRVVAGWAESADEDKIKNWRQQGLELVQSEMERLAQEETSVEYGRLMRKRLGLRRQDRTDESVIFKPLLNILQDHKLDFHSTFRKLCYFCPSFLADEQRQDEFIEGLLELTPEPERLNKETAKKDWSAWLKIYADRVDSEAGEWSSTGEDINHIRQRDALNANPRFVLRQWVLEEVIAKVERDPESGKRILGKVMHMASNPFEPWGGEDEPEDADLDLERAEERRYCGMGDKKMLGFQCSCSS